MSHSEEANQHKKEEITFLATRSVDFWRPTVPAKVTLDVNISADILEAIVESFVFEEFKLSQWIKTPVLFFWFIFVYFGITVKVVISNTFLLVTSDGRQCETFIAWCTHNIRDRLALGGFRTQYSAKHLLALRQVSNDKLGCIRKNKQIGVRKTIVLNYRRKLRFFILFSLY